MKLIAALGAARDIQQVVELAKRAEALCLDAILLDDLGLEPTSVLAAVATATDHIGLIAGTTTSYNEPYNIARRFLSLDHISQGRAGWHLSSGNEGEAQHYGFALPELEDRAAEFHQVVAALWDSWEDDALLRDKVGGDYMDRDKVHFLDHVGRHFKVRGPLNITRSAQGWPVVTCSPRTPAERAFAIDHADVIFIESSALADYAALEAPLVMPRTTAGADTLARWFEAGAADGFLVELTDSFARETVPALQRRGLFRTAYAGRTLRQHLDLPVPENRYTAARRAQPRSR